jgi:antitoxin component YwqK of YwqJK toxin-antitoxin module
MIADIPIEIWANHIALDNHCAFNCLRRANKMLADVTKPLINIALDKFIVKTISGEPRFRHIFYKMPNGGYHGRYEIIDLTTTSVCEYLYYKYGVLHGEHYWRAPNDYEWFHREYKDGRLNGKYTRHWYCLHVGWFTTECNYVDDMLHGVEITRDWDDRVERVGVYVHGKRHGTFTRYFTNGNISKITNYVNGLRHGIQKYYDVNGDITLVKMYENGKLKKDGVVQA